MNDPMTRQEIERQIIARAWQDESFKQELLSDPLAAFAKENINLPEDVDVRTVEESSNVFYLVLPPKPRNAEKLSLDELKDIAGGETSLNIWKCGNVTTKVDKNTTTN